MPSSGDFRKTVIGDSTRWKCFDAGISARNARMTSACIHQLIRPAADSSSSRQPRRNVTISVAMNSPIDDRFERDLSRRGATGRTNARRTSRKHDAGQHGDRKRRQHDAVGVEPRRVGQIDNPEAVQKLGDGVAAERDEAPEHERVREARQAAVPGSSAAAGRRRPESAGSGMPGASSEKVLGAAAISRTRVATCAANAPTNATTSSQRISVAIWPFAAIPSRR